MQGGTIRNNTGLTGGGVSMEAGKFTMSGSTATISGNTITISNATASTAGGGGLCMTGGTFNFDAGKISDHTISNANGAGVAITGGNMIMQTGSTGIITNNRTNFSKDVYRGGGVWIWLGSSSAGSLYKKGGTIYGRDNGDLGNYIYNGSSHQLDKGAAVLYSINGSTWKRRETTAGTGIDLDTNGSGNWE